jgi:hypothetical protein
LNFKNKVQICFPPLKWVICFIKYPGLSQNLADLKLFKTMHFLIKRNQIETKQKNKRWKRKKRKEKATVRPSSPGRETAHGPLTLPHRNGTRRLSPRR